MKFVTFAKVLLVVVLSFNLNPLSADISKEKLNSMIPAVNTDTVPQAIVNRLDKIIDQNESKDNPWVVLIVALSVPVIAGVFQFIVTLKTLKANSELQQADFQRKLDFDVDNRKKERTQLWIVGLKSSLVKYFTSVNILAYYVQSNPGKSYSEYAQTNEFKASEEARNVIILEITGLANCYQLIKSLEDYRSQTIKYYSGESHEPANSNYKKLYEQFASIINDHVKKVSKSK